MKQARDVILPVFLRSFALWSKHGTSFYSCFLVSEASWALFWTPKLGQEEVWRLQSDFICLLNDFKQNLGFLEKAKTVILRGRGVQNQHLQFHGLWYNDFSKNVIFDECIIVFNDFWGRPTVRATHFWALLEAPRRSKSIKNRAWKMLRMKKEKTSIFYTPPMQNHYF